MNFNKAWPKVSGWYMFLDIEYKLPAIGYYSEGMLYDGVRRHYEETAPDIRFGNHVQMPSAPDIKAEK